MNYRVIEDPKSRIATRSNERERHPFQGRAEAPEPTGTRARQSTGRWHAGPGAGSGAGARLKRSPYLIRLMMLNIGRYRAMTDNPTAPPTKKIITGSISEVSESTVAVTSSS